MATMTTPELLDVFKNMTVLELNEFLKAFETEFGVTAAPPTAVFQPTAVEEAPVEEQTEFTVKLVSFGDKKINVIKEVRQLAALGLKEAKDLVDNAPTTVLENVSKEDADAARGLLEAAGATVEVS